MHSRKAIGSHSSRRLPAAKAQSIATNERPSEQEIVIAYPRPWEAEYRQRGFVTKWIDQFAEMYKRSASSERFPQLSTRLQTLDLFPQYALMYLLRQKGFQSLTWYKLANLNMKSKNWQRTEAHWREMRNWMGEDKFKRLQEAISPALPLFKGEPDLFCWNADSGAWFFAEVKHRDNLTASELDWFRICRETLGPSVDLRVYRLRASD